MDYNIYFDKKNPNCIIIKDLDDKIITYIACPPINNGCDIINFGESLPKGYTYNFDGLILITTPNERKLYYKGNLIAQTKRNII
ncbi:MAG: hypothetical protein WC333_02400 [Dehalococcoidia bacterium]|jgi:hypothetical protein